MLLPTPLIPPLRPPTMVLSQETPPTTSHATRILSRGRTVTRTSALHVPSRLFPPSSARTPAAPLLAPMDALARPRSFDRLIARSTLSIALLVGTQKHQCIPQPTCLNLIIADSSTLIVDAIWPTSSTVCRSELGSKAVLPLRTFIQETLRRSRTSYSTLQVALYYLILIKPHVPNRNFTMEQLDDRHSTQALQCGRRMFLAALILASKYLQDRNYSARAWSKISGLNTQEINQNEMAFLQSVNWKLHIADSVFQRWTDIVLKYTPPPSPPSPGGAPQLSTQQHDDWRQIILGLNPELTNIDGLIRSPFVAGKASDLSPLSLRSIISMSSDSESAPSPQSCAAPMLMEPKPTSTYTPCRMGSANSMLPTPRLTPQSSGLSTPAAGSLPHSLGKGSSMGLAMAQANTVNAAQFLDRPPMSMATSPQAFSFARRSSLANSISTASSPESMISDTSRTSRSSSISSVSSLASATMHSKLSAPSRFRCAKLGQERNSRLSIPSVPEDYDEPCFSSSPESYTGPAGRPEDWSADASMAGRKRQLDDMASDAASDAARTLQALHSYRGFAAAAAATPSRRESTGSHLQDNVRDLLSGSNAGKPSWSNSLLRSRAYVSEPYMQTRHMPEFSERKRVCCSTEVVSGYETANVHPAIGLRGPGMWQGILN